MANDYSIFLLHESIGKENDEIIDMVFTVITHCWNLKPDENESKGLYWMAKVEMTQLTEIKTPIRSV